MNTEQRRMRHEWHVAVNLYHLPDGNNRIEWQSWMYEAMTIFEELPRLKLLHQMEREGKLEQVHQQCSFSSPEPVIDNHLTCCLGTICKTCHYLVALESAKLTPAQIDEAKAYTCVTHIAMSGGDHAGEGYILTESDKMFWSNTYRSMAGVDEEEK